MFRRLINRLHLPSKPAPQPELRLAEGVVTHHRASMTYTSPSRSVKDRRRAANKRARASRRANR